MRPVKTVITVTQWPCHQMAKSKEAAGESRKLGWRFIEVGFGMEALESFGKHCNSAAKITTPRQYSRWGRSTESKVGAQTTSARPEMTVPEWGHTQLSDLLQLPVFYQEIQNIMTAVGGG